MPREPLVFG